MKSLKAITAGLLALGTVAMANATTLHIGGSTAFRAGVHNAIVNLMGGTGVCSWGTNKPGGANSGSVGIYHGTIAGHVITIKTVWTGSLAGVVDLTEGTPLNFVADGAPTAVGGADISAYYNVGGANREVVPEEIGMADASASACQLSLATGNTPAKNASNDIKAALGALTDGGITASGDQTVGAVTFEWALSNIGGGAAPFTNVTQQQAAALVTNGSLPLSAFTGNNADRHHYVVYIGRNEDSGTRITYLAESQTGFGKSAKQWDIQLSGAYYDTTTSLPPAGLTVSGLKLWPGSSPLNTEPAMFWTALGHSGYIGGGDVVNVLNSTSPLTGLTGGSSLDGGTGNYIAGTSKVYLISCLGTGDSVHVTSGTRLNYNGVPYSVANVQNGLYSSWGYEHLYYIPAGSKTKPAQAGITATTGDVQFDSMNAIADQLFSVDAIAVGVPFNSLNYTRIETGTPIVPLF